MEYYRAGKCVGGAQRLLRDAVEAFAAMHKSRGAGHEQEAELWSVILAAAELLRRPALDRERLALAIARYHAGIQEAMDNETMGEDDFAIYVADARNWRERCERAEAQVAALKAMPENEKAWDALREVLIEHGGLYITDLAAQRALREAVRVVTEGRVHGVVG